MKEKKLIIGATVIIAIAVIIALIMVNGNQDKETKEVNNSVETTAGEETTNFWDNIEIFEGDGEVIQETEIQTEIDENGEVITKVVVLNPNSSVENGNDNAGDDSSSESSTKSGKKDKKGKKSDSNSDNNGASDNNAENSNGNSNEGNNSGDNSSDKNGNDAGNNSGENSGNNSDNEETTESYPGEADGWSPLVSPDDLK